MIFHVKRPPEAVAKWYARRYPEASGFSHDYYYYWSSDKAHKIWACYVSKDGKLFDYSTQAEESWYAGYCDTVAPSMYKLNVMPAKSDAETQAERIRWRLALLHRALDEVERHVKALDAEVSK